jgi:hypothetical protein
MWRCQNAHANSASANFCPTCGAPRASGVPLRPATLEAAQAEREKRGGGGSPAWPVPITKVSAGGKGEETIIGGFVITALDSTPQGTKSRRGGGAHRRHQLQRQQQPQQPQQQQRRASHGASEASHVAQARKRKSAGKAGTAKAKRKREDVSAAAAAAASVKNLASRTTGGVAKTKAMPKPKPKPTRKSKLKPQPKPKPNAKRRQSGASSSSSDGDSDEDISIFYLLKQARASNKTPGSPKKLALQRKTALLGAFASSSSPSSSSSKTKAKRKKIDPDGEETNRILKKLLTTRAKMRDEKKKKKELEVRKQKKMEKKQGKKKAEELEEKKKRQLQKKNKKKKKKEDKEKKRQQQGEEKGKKQKHQKRKQEKKKITELQEKRQVEKQTKKQTRKVKSGGKAAAALAAVAAAVAAAGGARSADKKQPVKRKRVATEEAPKERRRSMASIRAENVRKAQEEAKAEIAARATKAAADTAAVVPAANLAAAAKRTNRPDIKQTSDLSDSAIHVPMWPQSQVQGQPFRLLFSQGIQPLCRSGVPIDAGSYILYLPTFSSDLEKTGGRTNIAIGYVKEVFCLSNDNGNAYDDASRGWTARVSRLWFPEETPGGRKHHHGAREVLFSTDRPLCHPLSLAAASNDSSCNSSDKGNGDDPEDHGQSWMYPSRFRLAEHSSTSAVSLFSMESLVSLHRIIDVCRVRPFIEEVARMERLALAPPVTSTKRQKKNKPSLVSIGMRMLKEESHPPPHSDPGREFYVSHRFCHLTNMEVPVDGYAASAIPSVDKDLSALACSSSSSSAATTVAAVTFSAASSGSGREDDKGTPPNSDLCACHACRRFMDKTFLRDPCRSCSARTCGPCALRIHNIVPHHVLAVETAERVRQQKVTMAFSKKSGASRTKNIKPRAKVRLSKNMPCPVCEVDLCDCVGCTSEKGARLDKKHFSARTRERVPEDPNLVMMQVMMESQRYALSSRKYALPKGVHESSLPGAFENKKLASTSICSYCGDESPDRRCEHCWADVHESCTSNYGVGHQHIHAFAKEQVTELMVPPSDACSVVGRRINICEVGAEGKCSVDRFAIIDAYSTRRKKWRLVFEAPLPAPETGSAAMAVVASAATAPTSARKDGPSPSVGPWASVTSASDPTIAWVDLNSAQFLFQFARDVELYCYCRHSSNMAFPMWKDTIECLSCGEKYHSSCIPQQETGEKTSESGGVAAAGGGSSSGGSVGSSKSAPSFVCCACREDLVMKVAVDKLAADWAEAVATEAAIAAVIGFQRRSSHGSAKLTSARGRIATGGHKAKRMACITCPDCTDHEDKRRRANRWTQHRRAPLNKTMSERFGWRQSASLEWIYCINRWLVTSVVGAKSPEKSVVPQSESSDSEASVVISGAKNTDAEKDVSAATTKPATATAAPAADLKYQLKYQFVTKRGENDTPIAHVFSKLFSDAHTAQRTRCFDLDMRQLTHCMRGAIPPPTQSRSTHLVTSHASTRRPSSETRHLYLADTGENITSTMVMQDISTSHSLLPTAFSSSFSNFDETAMALPSSSGANRRNAVRSPTRHKNKKNGDVDVLATSRQKLLRFDRSLIHAWGLFADEDISANSFVIEYKGELVREAAMEERQQMYETQGRDDYIFRIDKDWFCDATVKGSMARFINHCCDPNCYTKIMKHHGKQKIVIYAKRDIRAGEELAYDYKFPYEEDKIVCNCGAWNCRGYMN